MYVPTLVKIHWRMLILEYSQGCYAVKIWPGDIDLWPWKSIGFKTLLRTKYVPSVVKIHWRMLILECSQGCYVVKIWPGDLDPWPWKSIGFLRGSGGINKAKDRKEEYKEYESKKRSRLYQTNWELEFAWLQYKESEPDVKRLI